ncbi:hypothetical protein BGZ57DRAFT_753058, partial [Hyaloscypha finlandica]
EYKAFELSVCGALALAVTEDPYSIAIQKAVPALNDRLRTMTGVIQNGQLTSAIDDFVGGSFTCQFAYAGPRTLPFTGAAAGPLAPAPLPLTALASAPSVPEYSMSRTIQTIPELW